MKLVVATAFVAFHIINTALATPVESCSGK
jgi:hypothetical protein